MPATSVRPLGVMILALLREGDMHPYEMMRVMRARRGNRFLRLQKGTFYHQVSALERDGFIGEAGVDREGNRPERTLYTLLPSGRDAVATWVRAHLGTGSNAEDVFVALAEAHNLERDEAQLLLSRRADALRDELGELRAGLSAALERGVDRQYLIELERRIALIAADVAWTDALVADIAAGTLAWGAPSPSHLVERTRKEDA